MVYSRPSRLRLCKEFEDCAQQTRTDDCAIHIATQAARERIRAYRHTPRAAKIDREFVDWLGQSNIPFSIVFTKADKLSVGKAKANAETWIKQLEDTWETTPPYFITSAEKKSGKEELLNYIEAINASIDKDTAK